MPIVSLWTDCLFARDRKSDESLGLDLLFTLNRYSFTKDKYLASAVKKARLRPVRSISPDTLHPSLYLAPFWLLKKDRTESTVVEKECLSRGRCEHEERRERECFASEPVAIRLKASSTTMTLPRSQSIQSIQSSQSQTGLSVNQKKALVQIGEGRRANAFKLVRYQYQCFDSTSSEGANGYHSNSCPRGKGYTAGKPICPLTLSFPFPSGCAKQLSVFALCLIVYFLGHIKCFLYHTRFSARS